MGKGIRVTVRGQYIARSGVMGKERILKDYEIEAIIPTMHCALSIVKNKLLTPILSKKHEDYVTYRTYHITKVQALDDEAKEELQTLDVMYMDRKQLLALIKRENLGVDSRLFPDLVKLREAVELAKNSPQAYAKKIELRKDDLELDLQLAKLNPELYESSELEPSEKTNTKPIKTPKKKLSKKANAKQAADRVDGLAHDLKKDGEMGDMDDVDVEDL